MRSNMGDPICLPGDFKLIQMRVHIAVFKDTGAISGT